ncbi:hypothetical protein ACWDHW_44055, partial [Streptomyces melanosporofaciens]
PRTTALSQWFGTGVLTPGHRRRKYAVQGAAPEAPPPAPTTQPGANDEGAAAPRAAAPSHSGNAQVRQCA